MEGTLHRPDAVFIDVGANLGLFGCLARRLGARLILFEPEPAHYAFLDRNDHLFDRVFPLALSDERGEVEFYVGDVRHSGASSMVMHECGWEAGTYAERVTVQAMPFDEVLDDHDLPAEQVALVKVDVEGHEESTIRGMQGYLARPDAAPLWCEVRGPGSDRGGGSYATVIDLVRSLGYEPFVFDGSHPRPFEPGGAAPLRTAPARS